LAFEILLVTFLPGDVDDGNTQACAASNVAESPSSKTQPPSTGFSDRSRKVAFDGVDLILPVIGNGFSQ
jgi:hypothetical protein